MIVNGQTLLDLAPIANMEEGKRTHDESGTSYGLSEAGYDLRIDQTVTLTEGDRFALASSAEYFQMPEVLIGTVKDKSTWARRGLSVFNTVIEPGWRGWLTLELVYHGKGDLVIPEGAGIAQVLFERIENPASYGAGKYQDQKRGPQEARSHRSANVLAAEVPLVGSIGGDMVKTVSPASGAKKGVM